jgi:hypothetical protein
MNIKTRIEFDTCKALVVKLNDLYIKEDMSGRFDIEHGYDSEGQHVTNLMSLGTNAAGGDMWYVVQSYKTYGELYSELLYRINDFYN